MCSGFRRMTAASEKIKDMADNALVLPDGYAELLTGLKVRVRNAQVRAQRVVNTQLIELYWQVGSEILEQQGQAGWGSGVIRCLAGDLRAEFPHMKGCLLYTSDAADDLLCVDLGGRRIIKKKKK